MNKHIEGDMQKNLVSGEIKPNSTTPRTDGLIARAMARHPGQSARAQADYYEDVHQDLAPLARQMESEIIDLVGALKFILAFYELGQQHLDTNAWKLAEAQGRAALAKAQSGISSKS